MRVYVAGSSHELDRARAAMALVRSLGGEITFDWTHDVEQLGTNPLDLATAERAGFAQKDLDAIDAADVVWLLAPLDRPSRGACVELGWALKAGKPTLITGPERARRQTIFFDLATVQRDDDTRAITVLRDLHAWGEELALQEACE